MKVGKASITAYYVACPHCDDALMDPSTGSYMIGRDSVDAFAASSSRCVTAKGQVVVACFGCGQEFALPAAVVRLGSVQ